jgi:hypothetical protein
MFLLLNLALFLPRWRDLGAIAAHAIPAHSAASSSASAPIGKLIQKIACIHQFGHPAWSIAASAASRPLRSGGQRVATRRFPVIPSESGETSHSNGGP